MIGTISRNCLLQRQTTHNSYLYGKINRHTMIVRNYTLDNCHLRSIEYDDKDIVFGWRNKPHIIKLGLSQAPVSRETHSKWFAASLDSLDRLMFIIETREKLAAGMLRFDREKENIATITIYLDEPFMGKGIGTSVLIESGNIAVDFWPETRALKAKIWRTNKFSIHSFQKAGFSSIEDSLVGEVIEMVKLL